MIHNRISCWKGSTGIIRPNPSFPLRSRSYCQEIREFWELCGALGVWGCVGWTAQALVEHQEPAQGWEQLHPLSPWSNLLCHSPNSWEGASVQAGNLQITRGKWGIARVSLIDQFNPFHPWALSGTHTVHWWVLMIFVRVYQFELKKCSHPGSRMGKKAWSPHTWDRAWNPWFNSLPRPILTL